MNSCMTRLRLASLILLLISSGLTGCMRAIIIQKGEVCPTSRTANVYLYVPDSKGTLTECKATLPAGTLIQTPADAIKPTK